tara:strand:+ start:113 stop:328 length:216 start_codon:yes stop_codon:yes gene_type:complete
MTRYIEVQVTSKLEPKPESKPEVLDGARVYLLRSEGKTWSEIQAVTGAKSEVAVKHASDAYAKMKDLYPLT